MKQLAKSKLETDIFNYHTPEFFINMKDIPPPKSELRGAFVSEEKRKCREGININGIFIPPGLYFHLNYYHLQGDNLETGKKEIMLPRLRDNEWEIFNDYHQCHIDKIIYTLFGARQISKSEVETSLCLRELCLFKETEAMALFSTSEDRDTFTKKLSTAITHGESFIIIPNIDKDLGKNEIRFGFTRPDNTTDIRARLYIYNTQEGRKIQISSGKSVSFVLFDEIAKADFKQVYDVLEPALLSDTGKLRCSPIMAFTGGEVEKAKDAENLVKNPTGNQFKTEYEDSITGQTKVIGGRLLDGLYRKDCKEVTKFSDYIGKKTNTWLDNTIIYVSNKKKALEKILYERKEAEKSTDPKSLILKKIFFPLCLDDIFLTEANNKFNINALKQHKEWLENHYKPVYADLYRNRNNQVEWGFSDLKPITKFPVVPSDNKLAPVCIYEMPIKDIPFGTYCIGIDPINSDDSNEKIVSLASINVYKRMLSPLDEFKNQTVCSWTGRFESLAEFHELALMIAEFYDAKKSVLPEASEMTLIQYFFHKKKGIYLADSFEMLKELSMGKFKGNQAKKGLPATTLYQRHYMNLMVEDHKSEEIIVDEEGNESFILGLSKIYDPMLLEEMINYKGKTSGQGVHDGNFDRIISKGCALTLAQHFDIAFPMAEFKPKESKIADLFKQKTYLKTPFGNFSTQTNQSPFGNNQKSIQQIPRWLRGKR